MNSSFQFILTGTKEGGTRLRVLKVLDERPQNAPQIAERLDVSQPTLDRHLTMLQENGLIEKRSAAPGAPYLITRRARANWDDVEELFERVEQPATPLLGIIAV